MIEVDGLVKVYGAVRAVDGVSLRVERGEILGLVGPNGAGKTTTLRMVSGLLKPDAGSISVCGIDTAKNAIAAKRVLAWVPDEPLIYDKLTPMEYLAFVAGLWGMDGDVARAKADQLIDVFGLCDKANERCGNLSKGSPRRWRWRARSYTSPSSSFWMSR